MLIKYLIPPLTLIIIGNLFFYFFPTQYYFVLLLIPFSILLAISTHRLILLENIVPPKYGLHWSGHEIRYLVYGAAIAIIAELITYLSVLLTLGLPGVLFDLTKEDNIRLGWFYAFGCVFPPAYFIGRVSLVFPSISIGEGFGIISSWKKTRGNSFIMAILIGFIPTTSLKIYQSLEVTDAYEFILFSLAYYIVFITEIIMLSEVYRFLCPLTLKKNKIN